jgi:hypothetical protein
MTIKAQGNTGRRRTTDAPILAIFGDRMKAASEIPSDYVQLTTRLHVETDANIIQSIWDSLKDTEALVTVLDNHCQFWRRRRIKESHYRQYLGSLKTR